MKQISFAQAEHQNKKKVTRRERFLAQMDALVPWQRLIDALSPSYFPNSAGKRGRPPIGLERMLRIYFLQQWYALADEALEDAIYDSQAMRDFVGIDLAIESVPDATTLLRFRHLLEQGLGELLHFFFEQFAVVFDFGGADVTARCEDVVVGFDVVEGCAAAKTRNVFIFATLADNCSCIIGTSAILGGRISRGFSDWLSPPQMIRLRDFSNIVSGQFFMNAAGHAAHITGVDKQGFAFAVAVLFSPIAEGLGFFVFG